MHEANKSIGSFSIYQDTRQPGFDEQGNRARDYGSGDLTVDDIMNEINNIDGFFDRINSRILYTTIVNTDRNGLFDMMRSEATTILSYQGTFGNGLGDFSFLENRTSILEMIERFRQDNRGINEIGGITRQIMLSDSNYQNYISNLENQLEQAISNVATVDKITEISLQVNRPIFNVGANFMNWNDSWSIKVQLQNIKVNCAQVSADLILDVYDHFGLDVGDMFTSGFSGEARLLPGFWAWLHLQRVLDVEPFINHFNTSTPINAIIEGS